MLRVELLDDPVRMQAAAFDFLARDEVANTVLLNALGIAARRWARGEAQPGGLRMAVATEHGHPVAVGLRGGAHLLLGGAHHAGAARAIGAAFAQDRDLAGVIGPSAAARTCAQAFARPFHEHVRLRLFALGARSRAGAAGGHLRMAVRGDLALLSAWQAAFERETRIFAPGANTYQTARLRIEAGCGFVWCAPDGRPVSHAGVTFVPPGGARIAPVYTPPEERGRGYAQALVAHACRWLRKAGARHVLLFADAANPTSNAVYRRVGFACVAEHAHLLFDA